MSKEPSEDTKFLNEKCEKQKQPELEEDADHLCGFWLFKGPRLQRFASEKIYVVLYGITGCLIAMAFAYFNGTLTTLEKRFRIPSKTSAIISTGNDISTTLSAGFLGYYAGRGHRPRWIAFGQGIVALFCLMMILPHVLYGPGEDALKLTREYVEMENVTEAENRKLCNKHEDECLGNVVVSWAPIICLFIAQFIGGIGCSLFFTLGLTYMDDNTTRSKTPALLSWSAFLRMLGPAAGFYLSSLCLDFYIRPDLHPLIQKEDPRWLGAWWLGWIVLFFILLISAVVIYMFPKELPSARERRLKSTETNKVQSLAELSFQDMLICIKRLLRNKVYVYNNIASLLYFFGYMPYWMFMPKYIETQYKQSASKATMATGTFGLGFSAAGVLLSGFVISRYKPSARAMAAWNGIVDLLTVAGLIGYVFIGCDGSDSATAMSPYNACSSACHCEYVPFAPICGADNVTYISPCHAGCSSKQQNELGIMEYSDCKCISNSTVVSQPLIAKEGPCPVDCSQPFYTFIAVMCFLKFVGSSGRTSNVLLALRCVADEDKSFALGFGNMVLSLLCFIPSPNFFGWLIDSFCLVWGKDCSSKGNCWLYDTKSWRYSMNLISASCIFCASFGTLEFGIMPSI